MLYTDIESRDYMTFIALSDNEIVEAFEEGEKFSRSDTFTCRDCGGRLKYRRRAEKEDGSTHYRPHFYHPDKDSECDTWRPGEVTNNGKESDIHKELKVIGKRALQNKFESIKITGFEKQVGKHEVDVLGEFDNKHDQYGNGICVEVQHEHKTKDIIGTTFNYLKHGYSVVWVVLTLDKNDWEHVYDIKNTLSAVLRKHIQVYTLDSIDDSLDLEDSIGTIISPETPTRNPITIGDEDPVQLVYAWRNYAEHVRKHDYIDDENVDTIPHSYLRKVGRLIESISTSTKLEQASRRMNPSVLHSYMSVSLFEAIIGDIDHSKPASRKIEGIADVWNDVKKNLQHDSPYLEQKINNRKRTIKRDLEKLFGDIATIQTDTNLSVATSDFHPFGDIVLTFTDDRIEQVENGVIIDIEHPLGITRNESEYTEYNIIPKFINRGYAYVLLDSVENINSKTLFWRRVHSYTKEVLFRHNQLHQHNNQLPSSTDVTSHPNESLHKLRTKLTKNNNSYTVWIPPEYFENHIISLWRDIRWERLFPDTNNIGDMYLHDYYISKTTSNEPEESYINARFLGHWFQKTFWRSEKYDWESRFKYPDEYPYQTYINNANEAIREEQKEYRNTDWMELFPDGDYTSTTYPYKYKRKIFSYLNDDGIHTNAPARIYFKKWFDSNEQYFVVEDEYGLPKHIILPSIEEYDRIDTIVKEISNKLESKRTYETKTTLEESVNVDPPSTALDSVQCFNCGSYWSPSSDRTICQSCGEPVNISLNVRLGRISVEAAISMVR